MNEKILRFLPKFYAKADEHSALRHLVDALGQQLLAAERALIRSSLSHYIDFASTDVLSRSVVEDLDRIGALYNIKRLERVEPNSKDEGELLREHRELLEQYRKRLKATIRIFLGGVATARAIVNTVAAVFGLEILDLVLPNNQKTFQSFKLTEQSLKNLADEGIPDKKILEDLKPLEGLELTLNAVKKQIGEEQTVRYQDLILKHVNTSLFGIKNDEYTTTAVLQRLERDISPFLLEIIDNPLRERVRRVRDKEASYSWLLEHKGLSGTNPTITIVAEQTELVWPVLKNISNKQMIIFNGTIPSGGTLVIKPSQEKSMTAKLNSEEVFGKLYFSTGGKFDQSRFDCSQFAFLTQNPRFPGLESGDSNSRNGDELALFLIPGKNEWEYMCLSEEFNESGGFDGLLRILRDKVDVFPGEIRFEWQERARAAFGVRIPRNISFLVSDREKELFINTVNMVKASGVEPMFDFQNIFREQHDDLGDSFSIYNETAPTKETHEQKESFSINGLFDRTSFDKSVFH